jgi:Family of unknown function (DUF6326)
MLFLFAYGDIFGFFSPGQLQEVMAGEISGMAITQVFLFTVSLYIAVASVMVFLSLVLRPNVNRWANIVLPSLYVVSIVASAIGETSAYYWFLSITESALLLLIVWYAWTWPRPSWGSPAAGKLPRSPTASASTSNDRPPSGGRWRASTTGQACGG